MEDVECVQVLKDGGELCFSKGNETTTRGGFISLEHWKDIATRFQSLSCHQHRRNRFLRG